MTYNVRHSISITVAVRQANDIDYHSTSVESLTLHFPLDVEADETLRVKVAGALDTVRSRWQAKLADRRAREIVRDASPAELAEAIELLRSRNEGERP